MGSSPLTRGKRDLEEAVPVLGRLIPAHAGKTHGQRSAPSRARAHPRSRGENGMKKYQIDWIQGSSPLTRGKLNERRDLTLPEGLIPAHAGKTARTGTTRARQRAHPRSRGENAHRSPPGSALSGSSPLTRGKPLIQARRIHAQGLIPAHAGKTARATSAARTGGAHPRSRGENNEAMRVIPTALWLIPAHAGKTRLATKRARRSTAHPRSRGENQ